MNSAAQVCGFALLRSNPLWLTVRALSNTFVSRSCRGGIGCGVQSGLMVVPTPKWHCRSRPFISSYPKARLASKGRPSFITCQQALASLCATALMATTDRLAAHFFWYQRLIAAS